MGDQVGGGGSQGNFILFACGHPFDLDDVPGQFVSARDDDGPETTAIGVLELLSKLLRFWKHFGADAARPQGGRQFQIID